MVQLQQGADASTSSRHLMLRSATRRAHEKLDNFTIASGFFSSVSAYTNYLAALLSFHTAYGASSQVQDDLAWLTKWKIDRHPVWLSDELTRLGHKQTSKEAPVPVFALRNRAALLGSLYVLAGSAVGARMLQRMLAERRIPTPGGSTYLAALASSLNWNEFLLFLEQTDVGRSSEDIVDGALATFEGVYRTLGGTR